MTPASEYAGVRDINVCPTGAKTAPSQEVHAATSNDRNTTPGIRADSSSNKGAPFRMTGMSDGKAQVSTKSRPLPR